MVIFEGLFTLFLLMIVLPRMILIPLNNLKLSIQLPHVNSIFPLQMNMTLIPTVCETDVLKEIMTSSNGSVAGLDSIRPQHIKDLIEKYLVKPKLTFHAKLLAYVIL